MGGPDSDFTLDNGTLAAIDLDSARNAIATTPANNIDLSALGLDLGAGRLMTSVPTYQGYAAALTRLARMNTLAERMDGRHWLAAKHHDAGIQGIWGSQPGDRATLQPSAATTSAEYDIKDNRTAFGVNVPLGDLLIGADAWIGQASAETSAAAGDGDMSSQSYAAALTATWQGDAGLYADARMQYANFSTGLAADGQNLTTSNDASALGAAAELGYNFDLTPELTLTPQAQLSWTEVTLSLIHI